MEELVCAGDWTDHPSKVRMNNIFSLFFFLGGGGGGCGLGCSSEGVRGVVGSLFIRVFVVSGGGGGANASIVARLDSLSSSNGLGGQSYHRQQRQRKRQGLSNL